MITITLNGQIKKINSNDIEKYSIENLINDLLLKKETIVAELNGEIIESAKFIETYLVKDDSLELIRFVGGG